MFGILTDTVTLVFSTFLPTFLTYKALSLPASQQSPNTLHPWLTYWITNSLVLSFPRILPFDSYLRLGIHIYLLVPGRAEAIYQTYLRPWLQEHETAIEEGISNAHYKGKEQLWKYLGGARDAVAGLFGGGAQAQQREIEARRLQAERERVPGGSYVQSLLARWSSESRVEQSAAEAKHHGPGGGEATLATRFGSLVSAAASVGIEHASNAVNAATSKAPVSPQPHPQSSHGDVIQSRISESFANMTAGFGDMKKSRSETEFERIEKEDAPTSEVLQSGARPAGWSGWWSGKSGGPSHAHTSSPDVAKGSSSGIDTSRG